LAKKYLSVDLGNDILTERSNWKDIKEQALVKSITLPPTNSIVAKQMRVAAGVAVISFALCQHIFCPIEREGDFAEAMSDLASEDPTAEARCRSALLAILEHLPDYNRTVLESARRNLKQDVTKCLEPLILEQSRDAFRADLDSLCGTAQKEWAAIQRVKGRWNVQLGRLGNDDNNWDRVQLWGPAAANIRGNGNAQGQANGNPRNRPTPPTSAESQQTRTPSSQISTCMWPALRTTNEDGSLTILYGMALFKDQIIPAEDEERERHERRASSNDGRNGGRRIRGMSMGVLS